MIQSIQPTRVVNQIALQREETRRENITLVVLMSIAFFFGCLLTLAILALVVLAK